MKFRFFVILIIASPAGSQVALQDKQNEVHRNEKHNDAPVRRNSVNVASVYRSKSDVLSISCSSSALNSDKGNDVTLESGRTDEDGVRRRNSINVASFMRSNKTLVEENPGILASLSPDLCSFKP